MSNYYVYREVKVMIAHKLMAMEGWKVYGYKEDRSDSMTDYYDPANWDGVAEKNGYILCVDVYGDTEPEEIRKYNYSGFTHDHSIEEAAENASKYIVVGTVPGHMAHPPKMNWHIEKDGIIIAKGNGILKYAKVDSYYNYSHYAESMELFKKDRKAYTKKHANDLFNRGYYSTMEEAQKIAENHAEDMESDLKLINQFEAFIDKIDTTCGGLLGKGDGIIYEKVTVTEYKKENKVVEDSTGSIKDGQCFILKSNFNYGCYKGLVYRIHETERNGQKHFHAYKLNGKLTKECTGNASRNNYWFVGSENDDDFLKWIAKGSIAWCHIKEVKTPYEVEKVVKKTIKAKKKNTASTKTEVVKTEETSVNSYTYEVLEDTDTRTGERIFLVKVAEKLSREEYITVDKYIKSLGGYYSRFKRAFLFKENPAEKLNATIVENIQMTELTQETQRTNGESEPTEKSISYSITEDQHTQTHAKIWIVKPEKELNKSDFTEVKRKLATLKGYYSSFVKGFIFKYDPTEALKTG